MPRIYWNDKMLVACAVFVSMGSKWRKEDQWKAAAKSHWLAKNSDSTTTTSTIYKLIRRNARHYKIDKYTINFFILCYLFPASHRQYVCMWASFISSPLVLSHLDFTENYQHRIWAGRGKREENSISENFNCFLLLLLLFGSLSSRCYVLFSVLSYILRNMFSIIFVAVAFLPVLQIKFNSKFNAPRYVQEKKKK